MPFHFRSPLHTCPPTNASYFFTSPSHFFNNASLSELIGRRMDESGTGETLLPLPIYVGVNKITNYEAARVFFTSIHNGAFQEAFTWLFPTPSDLDLNALLKFAAYDDLCDQFTKSYEVFGPAAWICVALLLAIDPNATSIQMSRVCFPSIEALITKSESESSGQTQEQDRVTEKEATSFLLYGFNQSYIDPHPYVQEIALQISKNMTEYTVNSGIYMAPYTSLVTSSMMGKSRLMKELTKYLPILYICLRRDESTGYPPQTKGLF